MLRRVSFVAPVCAGAARGICQLTDSNPVLQSNAAHRGFKSNVWVEESDKYWFSAVTQVHQGELPTECQAPSRIELYNFDQLMKKPDVPTNLDKHGQYSFKTQKRYSGRFAQDLEAFKAANKLDSNWWLSTAEVRRLNLPINMGARPCVQIITRTSKFFNADQFANPEEIQMRAYSGATGRAYEASIGSRLRAHAESIKAPNCIYFTESQAEALGLGVPPGQNPAEVPFLERNEYQIYSVDDVEHSAEFLKSLQRFPAKVPTFVISGKPLESQLLEAVKNIPNKTNFWVHKNEVTSRKFNLVKDAKGVAPPRAEGAASWRAFNVAQFVRDQDKIATLIGTYKPAPSEPRPNMN